MRHPLKILNLADSKTLSDTAWRRRLTDMPGNTNWYVTSSGLRRASMMLGKRVAHLSVHQTAK